jgi:hypothetical protein
MPLFFFYYSEKKNFESFNFDVGKFLTQININIRKKQC